MTESVAKPRRILYVGTLDAHNHGTCAQRCSALEDLGHMCHRIDVSAALKSKGVQRLYRAASRRLTGYIGVRLGNREIIDALGREPFDVLWVDRGINITAETLARVRSDFPQVRRVGYSPDDMMNPHNLTREFREALPEYEIFFTTKSYNVAELTELGCPRVEFVDNAYHPAIHKPHELTPAERVALGGPIGFIGACESERARSLDVLARNDIPVKVYCEGWDAWVAQNDSPIRVAGGSQHGDAFARVICAFDINLCFLRKVNRDLQTTRSIEVPACGSFLLAERTDEHLRLFEEGREAEFFSSDDELLEKVRYYLDHPEERARIAAAGRQRCLTGGYSNQDRLRRMLELVFQD